MEYTRDSKIELVKDVADFFIYLMYEKHLFFHPEDSFVKMYDVESKVEHVSAELAEVYDRLMSEADRVCEREGFDICGIAYNIEMGYMNGVNVDDLNPLKGCLIEVA